MCIFASQAAFCWTGDATRVGRQLTHWWGKPRAPDELAFEARLVDLQGSMGNVISAQTICNHCVLQHTPRLRSDLMQTSADRVSFIVCTPAAGQAGRPYAAQT